MTIGTFCEWKTPRDDGERYGPYGYPLHVPPPRVTMFCSLFVIVV